MGPEEMVGQVADGQETVGESQGEPAKSAKKSKSTKSAKKSKRAPKGPKYQQKTPADRLKEEIEAIRRENEVLRVEVDRQMSRGPDMPVQAAVMPGTVQMQATPPPPRVPGSAAERSRARRNRIWASRRLRGRESRRELGNGASTSTAR